MRLLPRTRRGNWLLATLVWCAACATWWWLLPIVPRVEIAGVSGNLGFAADSSRVFAVSGSRIRYWDVRSGRQTSEWTSTGKLELSCLQLGIAVESHTVAETERQTLVDLQSDSRHDISWWLPKSIPAAYSTSDGRYFVIAMEAGSSARTVWWDRGAGQTIAEFDGVFALAVAPDGRWLAAQDPPTEIALLAPASLTELRRFQRKNKWSGVTLSADGNFVMLESSVVSIFDAATGELRATVPARLNPLVFSDVGQAIGMESAGGKVELSRWSLTTGESLGKESFGLTLGSVLTRAFEEPLVHGKIVIRIAGRDRNAMPAWVDWLSQFPILSRFMMGYWEQYVMYDMRTGRELFRFTPPYISSLRISPDGAMMAAFARPSDLLQLWDVPPRKSPAWFLTGAALLALSIGLVAWRLGRKIGSCSARAGESSADGLRDSDESV